MTIYKEGQENKVSEVYYQLNTKNKSFMKMYKYLGEKGINNNKFFLVLYDKDLVDVDPYAKNLDVEIQAKIYRECSINYFYFLREIIIPYKLNMANLAINFGFINNWNMFVEVPTNENLTYVSRYLWYILFYKPLYRIPVIDKCRHNAMLLISYINNIHDSIPEYLKLNNIAISENTISIGDSSIDAIQIPRTEILSEQMARGLTYPIQWYNNFSFTKFNTIIFDSSLLGFYTAAEREKRSGNPYGRLITTTPADIYKTEEAFNAYELRKLCIKFKREMYDSNPEFQTTDLILISLNYKNLGLSKLWFETQCKNLHMDAEAIKREIMLQ